MDSQCVEQLSFGFLADRPVVVQPSAGQMTSDAGLLPIREFDRRWRFTERMIACLEDVAVAERISVSFFFTCR